MKLEAYGLSDMGTERSENQDAWQILLEDRFFILADGIGGAKAGEVASLQAVKEMCRLIKSKASFLHAKVEDEQEWTTFFKRALEETNQILYKMSLKNKALKGMGTTVCCLHLTDKSIVYANIGDSRIYRMRAGHLEQLSQDHSLLNLYHSLGIIDKNKSGEFPFRHVVTKALGISDKAEFFEPLVKGEAVKPGDLYLLCSDGLTDYVTNQAISQALDVLNDSKTISQKLIALAKDQKSHDNTTVLVIKVLDLN